MSHFCVLGAWSANGTVGGPTGEAVRRRCWSTGSDPRTTGRVRRQVVDQLGAEGEVGRAPGREQPLVAAAGGVGEAARVDRQPADGLGGVQQHLGPGAFGGGVQGIEVDDPAVSGLHRGDRNERGARGHRVRDALQRDLPHLDPAGRTARGTPDSSLMLSISLLRPGGCGAAGLRLRVLGEIEVVLRRFPVAGRISEPRRDRATASVSPPQSRPTVSTTMSGILPVLSP